MIFREREIMVIRLHYELFDSTGKMVQDERSVEIACVSHNDAINTLRKLINSKVEIRITQVTVRCESVHIVTDEVAKNVMEKAGSMVCPEKKRVGRPRKEQ